MYFSTIILALAGATTTFAAAVPAISERQTYLPCAGLEGTAQCCATDVLGLADLDCANPPAVPTSADDFQQECAAVGQRARCCAIPILGQALICETPVGVVAK